MRKTIRLNNQKAYVAGLGEVHWDEPVTLSGAFEIEDIVSDERGTTAFVYRGPNMWAILAEDMPETEYIYSLSDCVNWETNVMGDCGGRVEEIDGVVICENCRNKGV